MIVYETIGGILHEVQLIQFELTVVMKYLWKFVLVSLFFQNSERPFFTSEGHLLPKRVTREGSPKPKRLLDFRRKKDVGSRQQLEEKVEKNIPIISFTFTVILN